VIPGQVDSIVSSSIYAYTRENARRNLDRIPLPQCPVLRPHMPKSILLGSGETIRPQHAIE
jgi:hypothetical protein